MRTCSTVWQKYSHLPVTTAPAPRDAVNVEDSKVLSLCAEIFKIAKEAGAAAIHSFQFPAWGFDNRNLLLSVVKKMRDDGFYVYKDPLSVYLRLVFRKKEPPSTDESVNSKVQAVYRDIISYVDGSMSNPFCEGIELNMAALLRKHRIEGDLEGIVKKAVQKEIWQDGFEGGSHGNYFSVKWGYKALDDVEGIGSKFGECRKATAEATWKAIFSAYSHLIKKIEIGIMNDRSQIPFLCDSGVIDPKFSREIYAFLEDLLRNEGFTVKNRKISWQKPIDGRDSAKFGSPSKEPLDPLSKEAGDYILRCIHSREWSKINVPTELIPHYYGNKAKIKQHLRDQGFDVYADKPFVNEHSLVVTWSRARGENKASNFQAGKGIPHEYN